ncbi:putative F420-0 ABC transporter substrate-binding protein [Microbacterium paludicola]|uniref:putative F420-0 ABC transporter substrate-binding protein n=1 Tax=Microbacterium paludicola TaxID=300019 RepID=UPI0011A87EC4|nr:putative F420-0 ABC transporter substrate-binding protein [Microbacterium paludicola]
MPVRHRIRALLGVVLLTPLILVGCGTAQTAALDPAAASPSGYPVVVDNCGTTVTFDEAPERVLAVKSTSIEMLLALGLEERIVGTAFSDGPVADEWAQAATSLPVIDERVPGVEATADLEPDLVYAGWESNVTADGAGERETLASLGINTYVSPSACQDADYQPHPLTFDDVFDDILEMGRIFDVSDRAEALVSSLRGDLDDVEADDRGLTALWYSSGSDTPFVGAGIGAPQMVMDAAGVTNIAADVDATWSSLSWEAVVDANPDIIVLVDSAWGSAEKKIGVLESNPATAQLPAVANGRYLVVPFAVGEAGVRNVEAARSLLSQLETVDLP